MKRIVIATMLALPACVTDPKAFCLTPCAGALWAPLGVVTACAPQPVDDSALDNDEEGTQ